MDPDDPNAKYQSLSENAVPQPSAIDNNELNESHILEAKGLQDGEINVASNIESMLQHKDLVAERRQEILKKGSIPEFVRIRDSNDFYRVYQEANYRNRLLIESQHQQQMFNMMNGDPVD